MRRTDLSGPGWWAAGLGVTWGLLFGTLILGGGGRLLMAVIAWQLGARPAWDLGGTAQVVILGAAMGPPAGLVYAALRSRLPGGRWRRGLTFGGLTGAFWVAVYLLRPAGPIELRAAPWSAWGFAALLVGFGVAVSAAVESRLRPRGRPVPRVAAVAAVVLGLAAGALAFVVLVSR